MNIDAVIFTYLRPQHLERQIRALKNQTVNIRNIIVGHLESDVSHKFDFQGLRVVTFNKDPGIRSTFITCTVVPQNCEYIFLLNDDVLPGRKYVENVLSCMSFSEGAYGGYGMNIREDNYYNKIFPRSLNNENVLEVSAIGQSYFFPYKYLYLFFKHQMPKPWTSSDDLWFSYMLHLYNKKTYIAPHPKNDPEMWAVKKNLTAKDSPEMKLHKRNPKHKAHRKELISFGVKNGGWK